MAGRRGRTPSDEQARAIATVLRLDPGKLADAAAQRWDPHVALPADVRHHPHDPHPSNGYLFFLEDGRTAALIDPAGYPATTLMRAIAEGPYVLRYILITHKHADHCDATADVARAFPDAQIVMHKSDAFAIGPLAARALPIVDGDELPFGDNAQIRMLHTPGHTDGSSCFLFRSTLFTGDTLFAGSVGGAFGDSSDLRATSSTACAPNCSRSTTPPSSCPATAHRPRSPKKRPTTRSSKVGGPISRLTG